VLGHDEIDRSEEVPSVGEADGRGRRNRPTISPSRSPNRHRSSESKKMARRSTPRLITWCQPSGGSARCARPMPSMLTAGFPSIGCYATGQTRCVTLSGWRWGRSRVRRSRCTTGGGG
jgi:hypothetical protein